jgi:hypothetical protein
MVALNNRGVFFTLMALIVLSIFLFSTVTYSDFLVRESTQKRVESMDNFVFSTEKNIERQMFINGFRTIFAFETKIAEDGNYLNHTQEAFQESFFNGTIYGHQNNLTAKTNFSEMKSKIEQAANKVNMNILLTNPSLSVGQEDPWNVVYSLTVDFYAFDASGLATWNKTFVVKSKIPIDAFADPVYTVNTNGFVSNKIIKTPYSNFVSGPDVSNLSNHTLNSYYINSSSGPSFLMRLEGNLGPSANGLESLVNLEKLSSLGFTANPGKSIVDYSYFSSNPLNGCNIAGMPSWFRLNNSNTATYGVSC